MQGFKRIGFDELTGLVDPEGGPYYRIADFSRTQGDVRSVVITDLAERLHEAVLRVQLANAEGHPILSAWLPSARAALAEAWATLPEAAAQARGEA